MEQRLSSERQARTLEAIKKRFKGSKISQARPGKIYKSVDLLQRNTFAGIQGFFSGGEKWDLFL